MNNVFVSRSVGRVSRPSVADLPVIGTYIGASALGGALMAVVLERAGTALEQLDPLPGDRALGLVVLMTMACLAVLQLRGRMGGLPQRRRQVPRRWLTWNHRPLTAAAFGLMIGSGAFTYLGYSMMYTLALAAIVAPSSAAAAVIGVTYGTARGATVFATWLLRWFGSTRLPGLGQRHNALLAGAGALVVLALLVTTL